MTYPEQNTMIECKVKKGPLTYDALFLKLGILDLI